MQKVRKYISAFLVCHTPRSRKWVCKLMEKSADLQELLQFCENVAIGFCQLIIVFGDFEGEMLWCCTWPWSKVMLHHVQVNCQYEMELTNVWTKVVAIDFNTDCVLSLIIIDKSLHECLYFRIKYIYAFWHPIHRNRICSNTLLFATISSTMHD